jgi:hypothetical protein
LRRGRCAVSPAADAVQIVINFRCVHSAQRHCVIGAIHHSRRVDDVVCIR